MILRSLEMIKRLYKRFLLWALAPALGEVETKIDNLGSGYLSEIAVLQSQINALRCR